MKNFNKSDILELCKEIDMPREMTIKILESFKLIDTSVIDDFYYEIFDFLKAKQTYDKIHQYTYTLDNTGVCELVILLAVAVETYDKYVEKGIPKKIYIDTMKCFSRFVLECYKWTGKWTFDRGFWVWRQLSLVLFRIGTLEFEICEINYIIAKKLNLSRETKAVSIHIPNDAKLCLDELDDSYNDAKIFFQKYFGERYIMFCSSWLLGEELDYLIKNKNSGILNFRKNYNILDEYFKSEDYLQWVFDKFDGKIEDFEPKTSLQMNIKKHILSGKSMTVGIGILKN